MAIQSYPNVATQLRLGMQLEKYPAVAVDSLAKNVEIRRLNQGSRDQVLGMEFSIGSTIPPTANARSSRTPLCYETTIAVEFLDTVISSIYLLSPSSRM